MKRTFHDSITIRRTCLPFLCLLAFPGCAPEFTCEDDATCPPPARERVFVTEDPFEVGQGEDCLNGRDDDLDGQVDCADQDCDHVGFDCASTPLPPWSGPWVIRVVPVDAPPSLCADGTPPSAFYAEPAGDPDLYPWCEPCSCDSSGIDCSMPPLHCSSQGCGVSEMEIGAPSSCMIGQPEYLFSTCRRYGSPSPTALCVASGGAPIPQSPWLSRVDACPADGILGAGCGSDLSCAPASPFESIATLCIAQDGEQECPAGWQTRSVAYRSVKDTRSCSKCSCGTSCAGGIYLLHDDLSCSDGSVAISSSCVSVGTYMKDSEWSLEVEMPSAVCNPIGGMNGKVYPEDPVTLCCR